MLTVSSCTVSSLQASPNMSLIIPAPLVIGARVFQIFYGNFQVDFGLLLNVLLFKKLRTVSSGIVVQIAIANLVLAISNGICEVVNKPAGDLILGLVLCITSGCAIYFFLFEPSLFFFSVLIALPQSLLLSSILGTAAGLPSLCACWHGLSV